MKRLFILIATIAAILPFNRLLAQCSIDTLNTTPGFTMSPPPVIIKYVAFGQSGQVYVPSTYNSVDWTVVDLSPTVTSFAISGNNIFAGTYTGGVFLSTNNGGTWTAVNNGLTSISNNNYGIALAVSGQNIFAGINNEVFLSTDSGGSWTAVDTSLTDTVYTLAISGSNIFAGTLSSGVLLSTNNGSTWTPVNNGLTDTNILSLAISGRNIFAGTDSILFLSVDSGGSWTAVNNGLAGSGAVTSLAISGSSIFAATYPGGIYLSTNNGGNWMAVNNGLPAGAYITSIAVSDSSIFAGIYDGGVFLSTNNGSNWTAVNAGLTDIDVRSLAISGSNILAGTYGGTYLSTNYGATVDSVHFDSIAGLPTGITYAVNPASGTIDGGQHGCVWFSGTTSDAAGTYELLFNGTEYTNLGTFPITSNNFTYSFTVINFQGSPLSATASVTSACYDSSNGSITVNATGGLQPYQYQLNGSGFQTGNVYQNLPAGIYSIMVQDTLNSTYTLSDTIPTFSVTITANGSTSFCAGANVTLDAGAGYAGYKWSNADTTQSITVDSTGKFNVTVTNTGCSATSDTLSVTASSLPGPAPDFTFVNSCGEVSFTNTSLNFISCFWNFGDGVTSNISNPFHQYTAGTYNACLSAYNTCLPTGDTITLCKTVSVLGISSINTNVGGNTGAVTVEVTGNGFEPGMQLYLRKAGQPNIFGDTLIIQSTGLITTDFNLIGQALGQWDVVAIAANGDSAKIPNGFTIEQGDSTQLWVSLTGDRILRIGFDQVYTLTYGNNGNTDAVFVPLDISGLPLGTVIQVLDSTLNFHNIPIFDTLGNTIDSIYTTVNDSSTSTSLRIFYIGKIPAGSTRTLQFIFHVPNSIPTLDFTHYWYTINATLGNPIYASTDGLRSANATITNCTVSLILNLANLALVGWPACVSSSQSEIANMWQFLLDASNNESMNVALADVTQMSWGAIKVVLDCGSAVLATALITNPLVAGTILGIDALFSTFTNWQYVKDCTSIYFPARHTPPAHLPVGVGNATDPNNKFGPGGGSTGHFISSNYPLSYVINFENDSSANLPAQTVKVLDTLNSQYFNYSSFKFTSVTIADSTFALSYPSQAFIQDFNFTSTLGVTARVVGSFDTATGIAQWKFYTIDPSTNQIDTNALSGFLPPNRTSPEGQAYVSFVVNANPNIQSGDSINNTATIIFDNNLPILTNSWKNYFDLIPPVSHVNPVIPYVSADSVLITWTGTDNYSGIRCFTIYYSTDSINYFPWFGNTGNTSGYFAPFADSSLSADSTYYFYSIAQDSAGNIEATPSHYEAKTTFITTGIKYVPSAGAGISIYPNPNNGCFTLDIIYPSNENNDLVSVVDILGRTLYDKQVSLHQGENLFNIDLKDLPQGLYNIQLCTSKGASSLKFITQ